jgi:hypothetical protein
MSADPDPLDAAVGQLPGDVTVVISHPDRKAVSTACEPLEIEGGMLRVLQPEAVVFLRESLYFFRQILKEMPKTRLRCGFHAWAGQGLV